MTANSRYGDTPMTDNEAERMERLDAAARAQNSLLEHPRCVTHHACDCLQVELDRLKTIGQAAVEAVVLLRAGKDIDAEVRLTAALTPNSDLETP